MRHLRNGQIASNLRAVARSSLPFQYKLAIEDRNQPEKIDRFASMFVKYRNTWLNLGVTGCTAFPQTGHDSRTRVRFKHGYKVTYFDFL